MKNIRVFLSENFQFLEVKFSLHLNRHIFIMLEIRIFKFAKLILGNGIQDGCHDHILFMVKATNDSFYGLRRPAELKLYMKHS